ncbi:porin family protein [Ectothiorhodospiraceae bacterium 2226]|nr:porin family protein [Ectothiorhodospiraceae bacterium 2226]
MAAAAIAWTDEAHASSSGADTYLALSVSGVFPSRLQTTSPDLSPARIGIDRGADLAAAIGHRYRDVRFEAEALYGRYDADDIRFAEGGGSLSGDFELRGATLNLYYDVPARARTRPYLGAGIGLAHFRARDVALSGFPPTTGRSTVPVYKLMAGVSYAATDATRVLVGYRYLRVGSQDYETGGVALRGHALDLHAVQVGVQVLF